MSIAFVVLEKLKKNWVLILFYILFTGVLIGYAFKSERYLPLMLWIIVPASNYIYKKFIKKGH